MSNHRLPNPSEMWLQTLGWQPTPEQAQQFERLFQQVLEANQQLNLTRITDPQEFWEKHLWDSLVGIAPWLSPASLGSSLQERLSVDPGQPLKVIDIGTGGGFPGLPIAVIKPTWQITLLDSTQKKLTFLEQVVADLGLEKVGVCCDRAETLGQSPCRESFDLALIRAVGPATVCAEYALPLVALQGYAVLYRGQWTTAEQEGLVAAVSKLGGEVVAVLPVTMPYSQSIRHCIYLRKIQPSDPKFPRRVGVPARKPL